MKYLLVTFSLLCSFTSTCSFASSDFPETPDPTLTPGTVCMDHDNYRYDEQISYCSRNVSKGTKREVIRNYDEKLGYRVEDMDRGDFKIDHYIPLCMGGGNDVGNLWPQHKSVYQYTDLLEDVSCQKMSQGKLLQAEAIRIMRLAKNNLSEAAKWTRYVQNL